jgi:hypothetical protein
VWEALDTTMEAEAHRQLACSAYASPSQAYWVRVRGHCGLMVSVTRWPVIRDLESEFAEGGRGGASDISDLEEELLANARVVGEVAPGLEQHRGDERQRHSGGSGK